jgi:hypothetical protein
LHDRRNIATVANVDQTKVCWDILALTKCEYAATHNGYAQVKVNEADEERDGSGFTSALAF